MLSRYSYPSSQKSVSKFTPKKKFHDMVSTSDPNNLTMLKVLLKGNTSLCTRNVSDEEKKFYNIATRKLIIEKLNDTDMEVNQYPII
jgi:hypothetical protein